MRTEQITAKALHNTKNDRYLLAIAVSKRADELAKGAESKINVDYRSFKYSDVALMEIAEGFVQVIETE